MSSVAMLRGQKRRSEETGLDEKPYHLNLTPPSRYLPGDREEVISPVFAIREIVDDDDPQLPK